MNLLHVHINVTRLQYYFYYINNLCEMYHAVVPVSETHKNLKNFPIHNLKL